MAHIIRMADNVSPIPPGYEAIAGYMAGHWPTAEEQWFKDYHAIHKVTVAIWGAEMDDAEALDCEPGDEWPITTRIVDWVRRQQGRGVHRPVLYVSASYVDELAALLSHSGLLHARDFKIWSAHYGIGPHLCGQGCSLCSFKVDATQYTDRARNQSLDETLAMEDFFDFSKPKPAAPPAKDWHLHLYDTHERLLLGKVMSEEGSIKAYADSVHQPNSRKHLDARADAKVLFDRLWTVTHTGPNGEHLVKGDWLPYHRGARAQGLLHAYQGTL